MSMDDDIRKELDREMEERCKRMTSLGAKAKVVTDTIRSTQDQQVFQLTYYFFHSTNCKWIQCFLFSARFLSCVTCKFLGSFAIIRTIWIKFTSLLQVLIILLQVQTKQRGVDRDKMQQNMRKRMQQKRQLRRKQSKIPTEVGIPLFKMSWDFVWLFLRF
jgi:hypothetical protein